MRWLYSGEEEDDEASREELAQEEQSEESEDKGDVDREREEEQEERAEDEEDTPERMRSEGADSAQSVRFWSRCVKVRVPKWGIFPVLNNLVSQFLSDASCEHMRRRRLVADISQFEYIIR